MGIINVTPDSFSDGGLFFDPDKAVEYGLKLEADGADIIDIGGESTRPGSLPVSAEDEIRRVIPVIKGLAAHVKIPISIDTYRSEVAELAVKAGASIINDISALRFDPDMVNVAREYNTTVVLMHMLGTPQDMQRNPSYSDVIHEVYDFLRERIEYTEKNGITPDKIVIDPGVGFGKRLIHNLTIIRHLDVFKSLQCPVLIGPSRKSFIGEILNVPVGDRVYGTAAVVALSINKGADIIRIHDVKAMKQVAKMTNAILK